MKMKKMLVNADKDELRIALLEQEHLIDLHIQKTERERTVGNVYCGRVVSVNPAFQAVFVDYGEERNGFLSVSDINPMLAAKNGEENGSLKIQSVLRVGDRVMVQVLKEGLINKGPSLTTNISLPGRFMVVSPFSANRTGISRRMEDHEERSEAKEMLAALGKSRNFGIILRTAGIGANAAELQRELDSLTKVWEGIEQDYKKDKSSRVLHQEPHPMVRMLRDYYDTSIKEVWVDEAMVFQSALQFFKATLPRYQKRLQLYVGDKSLFSTYRVEQQISALNSNRVELPSGGSLVIETTEAMVCVDVNSGRSTQGNDVEQTAKHTNLEAANEVARQLRLRNLGGLVVIDFIDMEKLANRAKIEKALKDALYADKARTTLGSISRFGLLEMSRQRIDMDLSHGMTRVCPTCQGRSMIPTTSTHANQLLRQVRDWAAAGKHSLIRAAVPMDTANYLLNECREALRDLELEFGIEIVVHSDANLPPGSPVKLGGDHHHHPDEGRAVHEVSKPSSPSSLPRRSGARKANLNGDGAQNGVERERVSRNRPRREELPLKENENKGGTTPHGERLTASRKPNGMGLIPGKVGNGKDTRSGSGKILFHSKHQRTHSGEQGKVQAARATSAATLALREMAQGKDGVVYDSVSSLGTRK